MTKIHSYSERDTSANVTPRQGRQIYAELRRSVGAVMPAIEALSGLRRELDHLRLAAHR